MVFYAYLHHSLKVTQLDLTGNWKHHHHAPVNKFIPAQMDKASLLYTAIPWCQWSYLSLTIFNLKLIWTLLDSVHLSHLCPGLKMVQILRISKRGCPEWAVCVRGSLCWWGRVQGSTRAHLTDCWPLLSALRRTQAPGSWELSWKDSKRGGEKAFLFCSVCLGGKTYKWNINRLLHSFIWANLRKKEQKMTWIADTASHAVSSHLLREGGVGEHKQASGLPDCHLTHEFKTLWNSEVGGFLPGSCAAFLRTKNRSTPEVAHLQNSQPFVSPRKPEQDAFCIFSPPFGMPQPSSSKPSASNPADKSPSYPPCHAWPLSCCQAVLLPSLVCCQRGFWYLWAAEGPQGSELLLHSEAAVLLQGQGFTHTQPYRSGFQPGTRAAGVSPALSSGRQHPLSCRKEGRGHMRHAADRGSDAWSQSWVLDLPHHGWNKQLFQYIEIHYGPLSNKMKCKLLATVINWSTVLTDYNYAFCREERHNPETLWPLTFTHDHKCRAGAAGQGSQLTCTLPDRLPSATRSQSPHCPPSSGITDLEIPISHGWTLLLSWEALISYQTREGSCPGKAVNVLERKKWRPRQGYLTVCCRPAALFGRW